MTINKIYIGGWLQRTTLHLTELYDFLKYGKSHLDFPAQELEKARTPLGIMDVTRESGPLEYILVKTGVGIEFRMYEDGLIVLEKEFGSLPSYDDRSALSIRGLREDFDAIKDYYDNKLAKSFSLIYSKGAPIPKELANIKTILPYIVTASDASEEEARKLFADFNEEIHAIVASKNTQVYRGAEIIFINNLRDEKLARSVIESQIFFREFKSQLHRYLNIHRIVWEKIDTVKDRQEVKGTEIDIVRNELADYQKTIQLIGARIDQMDAYLQTRQKITNLQVVDEYLQPLFQFKFETLADTHKYIKYMWVMTQSYLDSVIQTFVELQQKSTKNTISSLQLITAIGVVAAILGYLGKDTLPKFTPVGLFYFALLLAMTWLLNGAVAKFFKNKKYQIKSRELKKI
mgnify:CR=1 FL=1